MKKFFAAAIALSLAFSANAQIKVGAGLMTGLPIGSGSVEDGEFSFSDSDLGFGFGIGGGISGEYMITDNIGAGLSVGFLSFSSNIEDEPDLIEQNALTIIPIQLFGNYYFMPGEDFNFYAGIGVGFSLVNSSRVFFGEEIDISGNGVAFTPRVGATYMFSDVIGIDLNVGYTILNSTLAYGDEDAEESSDFSYIPINLGIVYVIE